MKHTLKLFLALILLLSFQAVQAQKGTVRGTIIDDATGETIIGVTVMIPGTTIGTRTDLEGKYSLKIPAGKQTLKYSFVSFAKQEIKDINVVAGKVTVLDIRLKKNSTKTKTVVIYSQRKNNSETALLTKQRKSANVLDGASSETFKKTGDNDAAVAVSRVTGVSVEGGKYIYVRGLGDRYTKSQLNGVDIPGLDPDRNTIQMDIFPTNLLDNIVVYKSFTPNLPGDFTGGMVNIETKSFVDKPTTSFGLSLGYVPGMHFNSEALTYKSGTSDFFAMGNRTRKLPIASNTEIPNRSANSAKLTELTSQFNSQLAPTNFTAPLNTRLSFSKGNQIKKKKVTLAYNTALNYNYQFRHYDDFQMGRSLKNGEAGVYQLTQNTYTNGERSEQEVGWSGLLGGAIKTKKSKYTLNLLHTQNAVSRAAEYDIRFPNGQNTALPLKQYVLDYSQRSVSNALLAGKHFSGPNKWKVEWKLSPTFSRILEPDVRSTTYLRENGAYQIDNGDGAVPVRFYRTLNEVNGVGKLDFSRRFKLKNERTTKLMVGIANTFKKRDFQVLSFIFNNTSGADWTGNGDELLEADNLWSPTNKTGTYLRAEESLTRNPNIYDAMQNVAAAYIMNEYPINEDLKAVYGIRAEKTDNWISGFGRFGDEQFDEVKTNEKVMDVLDILPALNLIYSIDKRTNLRFSYSRTLARPSFKEKSFVSILDPLSNIRFIGNIGLQRTTINNLDLRYEKYFKGNEIFSASAFYKRFENPIEIAGYLLEPNDITPRNAGTAHLMGAEFELRKNLGFLAKGLSNFSVNTNVTLIQSCIDMREIVVESGQDGIFGTTDDVTEHASRSSNLREGETLGNYRAMFGQSPYIINAGINYTHDSSKVQSQLSYNVQGKRLSVVGVGVRPDVYDQPFHSLNFKLSKRHGKKDQWRTSFTVRNILNQRRQRFFESYMADTQVFESFNPGTNISIGINYLLQ